jgi:hypothetical protein
MTIGYDNWRVNQELVLDLQFREYSGTVTRDWAKPYHDPVTLVNGPTWSLLGNDLTYLNLACADQEHLIIAAAAATDLDFTTGDFSGAAWFYPTSHGERYIFNHGTGATGWKFGIRAATWEMLLYTLQAGPTIQASYSTPVTTSVWQFVGFNRDGANVRMFVNGRDRTTTPGTHVDPATAAAQNFYVGCGDLVAAGWLCGDLWRPRVWKRKVEAWEMLAIYEAERDLFGV